eukprot:2792334-Pleurochrysis_carterae.AAC.3
MLVLPAMRVCADTGRPIWALRVGALAEKLKDRDVTEATSYPMIAAQRCRKCGTRRAPHCKYMNLVRAHAEQQVMTEVLPNCVAPCACDMHASSVSADVCLKFEGCQALARAITINETLKRICLEGIFSFASLFNADVDSG